MIYDNELGFLCEVFGKHHLRARTASLDDPIGSVLDMALYELFQYNFSPDDPITTFIGVPEDKTLYKVVDTLHLCYAYLLLPAEPRTPLLLVGPYLREPLSTAQLFELGEKNSIPPSHQDYLKEYFKSLPVIPTNSILLTMLHTFCERVWKSPSFSIADYHYESQMPASPIHELAVDHKFDEVLVGMKAMEARYKYENELMQAISLGQIHKESQLQSAFTDQFFEKRSTDPLRNAKNYCIIMNTLARKAAEQGGVHPIYLDRTSSSFALKIERLPSLPECATLMRSMFRSYCRLVRKHTMKTYSAVVQKAILTIDSDLSADLTLSSLAKAQEISPGYLSSVFKKETGQTVSEYIRNKRIKHAVYLLSTTHLQVQTVALHCGIMDVQYFSKIFKKQMGKTPKEYREEMKNAHKNIP